MKRFAFVFALFLVLTVGVFSATDFAWSGNSGWISFDAASTSRVAAADTLLHGFTYAANIGWINLGNGSPANGTAYGNVSATEYGVNHDGRGELSGYAYSANVGWINFGWAGPGDPKRPRVDLVTGAASGYAYSANAGWINLSGLVMPGVKAAIKFPNGTSNPIAGSKTTLNLDVAGSESLKFQWFRDGVALAGATGMSYLLPSLQRFHMGDYSVRITREDSSMFDVDVANLGITAPPPNNARLLSLSTRALSLTGDNVLIPGFVIQGTGTKRLLIRAVGPTLGKPPFSIGGVLPDPVMTLNRKNGASWDRVDINDNWVDAANAAGITQAIADLFAFALTDDLDSAMLVDLTPGIYTVVSSGVNDSTGIAIVELYDADTVSTSSMTSISNRGFVGVGNEVMIPGFVVSNEGPKTFLIRVVGPTLAGFGVSGTMDDPQLTVVRRQGATETPILSNDNWEDNPDSAYTAQISDQVFAFPLKTGSADASVVATLQPGVYTVIGSSADGIGTGVVIVEVYVVQ